MGEKPFQYSLFSLFVLTTACAVLLSLVKTFPNASASVAAVGLMVAGPLLFFSGSLLIYHSELFFRNRTRFVRVFAPLAGFLCILLGVLFVLFLICI